MFAKTFILLAGRTAAFLSKGPPGLGRCTDHPAVSGITRAMVTNQRGTTQTNNIRTFVASTTNQEGSSSSIDDVEGRKEKHKKKRQDIDESDLTPPWSFDLLSEKRSSKKRNNVVRVRQHVNPLARRFQLPTILSENWPADTYEEIQSKQLFLDIGVGKGGFLLKLASERPTEYNYLGLEIRPLAVQFAKERLHTNEDYQASRGSLDFVGCNANVDLDRLLSLYKDVSSDPTPLGFVSVQFPDPHFKERHKRRRVVTRELIHTLAKYMPPGATVFLQSDVQTVLDDMRERFREEAPIYFQDQIDDIQEYHPENLIGIPTEREISVLKQDLPVYRAVFVRTEKIVDSTTP